MPRAHTTPLGIWINRKLQTIAKQQESYFRNSFELRQQLCSTAYPPNAKLFTANAVSMYTNIPTNTAIMLIAKHIRKSVTEERPKQNEALIYKYLLTLPIHLGSFPASSTVHYFFVFSPSARITMTGFYAQGCFSNDCRPMVTRVTKLNLFSTKQYHEPNNTLDQQTR